MGDEFGTDSSHGRADFSADPRTTIGCVREPTAQADSLASLSEAELEALVGAATWYAKYHERIISELADDHSALAVARRTRHQELYNGLAKLGVRLRRPAGIIPAP